MRIRNCLNCKFFELGLEFPCSECMANPSYPTIMKKHIFKERGENNDRDYKSNQ